AGKAAGWKLKEHGDLRSLGLPQAETRSDVRGRAKVSRHRVRMSGDHAEPSAAMAAGASDGQRWRTQFGAPGAHAHRYFDCFHGIRCSVAKNTSFNGCPARSAQMMKNDPTGSPHSQPLSWLAKAMSSDRMKSLHFRPSHYQ